MKKRVGVIMGGPSAEREVALASGRRVAEVLAERGHSVASLDWILGHLPQNNLSEPPRVESGDPIDRRDAALDGVPRSRRRGAHWTAAGGQAVAGRLVGGHHVCERRVAA